MSEQKERSVKFTLAEVPKDEDGDARAAAAGAAANTESITSPPPALNGNDDTKGSVDQSEAKAVSTMNMPAAAASVNGDAKMPQGAAAGQSKPSAVAKDVIGAAPPRPRFVYCEECGKNIPMDEWPDHRDRLRKVNLVEKMTTFQRSALRLVGVFLMWVLRNVYFREITVVSAEHVPKAGATVFYGNHQNQFIDALMLNSKCGRQVRFIMAEKSFHQPVMGFFGRIFNSVPVVRPQDVPMVAGEGKLVRMEGAMVMAEKSAFTKSLAKGDVISWSCGRTKCRAQVSRIHTDTELEVTIPITEESVVSEPTDYQISRRIDHSEMYGQVYSTLQQNHCIGIFPEGGSHDHTSLVPLKAGVALFSLGAAERNIPVKVIPCGLTYLYGHKFRSRAYLEFGEPITPSEELVQLFSKDKREATRLFLEQLNDALRAVTINVPDWETLKFLHSFRQLYTPANCTLSAKDYLRLTRRLSVIIERQKDDPEFVEFRERVMAYKDFCSALLVRDSQVATLNRLVDPEKEAPQIRLLLRRLFMLFLMGVILFPFFVFCVPMGLFLESYSARKSKAALAASKIKVVGADVRGSYKILGGIVLLPIEGLLITLIIYLCTDARTALVMLFSLPMAMYVSLLILQEAIMELRAALPLFMSLLSKHKQFKKLYEKREALVELAKGFVRRYDPELEKEMQVYTQVSEVEDDLGREPSLFSLRYNVHRRQATNA